MAKRGNKTTIDRKSMLTQSRYCMEHDDMYVTISEGARDGPKGRFRWGSVEIPIDVFKELLKRNTVLDEIRRHIDDLLLRAP